jgi:phosphatidylserine/phosphatidylglycerophosphate/cardiolipin synthase-like enzyme
MKLKAVVSTLHIFAMISVVFAQADHVVISEIRYDERSGITEEFVELYNPTENTVLIGGWEIEYRSASGTDWLDKVIIPQGTELFPRSFFLWGGNAVEPEPDLVWEYSLGLGNSGGHVRVLDDDDIEIDKVGWEGAIDPEGGEGNDAGTTPDGGSLERKANADSDEVSMRPEGEDGQAGNGYDSDVNSADFVVHDLDYVFPQNGDSPMEPETEITDGSGTCTVDPEQVFGGFIEDISFTVQADDYFLASVRITLPEDFNFSGSIALSGSGFSSATYEINGNICTISAAELSGEETGTATFLEVTPPNITNNFHILVETAVPEGTLTSILSLPVLQVLGDNLAISMLHDNDENGLPNLLGELVFLRGLVTAATELGQPSFIQDETGGVALYDWDFGEAVEIGDDVELSGTVVQWNGLVEIQPVTLLETHSSGNEIIPLTLTCHDIDTQSGQNEPYEALLVRIDDVTVNTDSWAGNSNYVLTDASGTCTIRIDSESDLVGTNAPSGSFDVIALVGQYDYSQPYSSGYQLLPRFEADIIQAPGPVITYGPQESEILPGEVSFEFGTENPGNTVGMLYTYDGATMLDSIAVDEEVTDHEITFTGLTSGSPYLCVVASLNDDGTSISSPYVFASASDPTSTGAINVYFTQSVETAYAIPGNEAWGSAQPHERLIERIDQANYSIDACLYSLSIQSIADALIDAHDRGVEVRFIYDDDHNQNQVIQIEAAGITVIDDSYGQNDGNGLQHNKFLVFDARNASSASDDWVWTGSLNLISAGGMGINAMQNSIEIQDQSLALAYTLEFNEMWGSSTTTPDPNYSLFGDNKTDNTPHHFMIGGSPVEAYFSPSDQVTNHLIDLIGTSEYSSYFCMFAFTRGDINDAFYNQYTTVPGYQVRGVFDSGYDQYSEYEPMIGWGADVHLDDETGTLHHKYLICDAEHVFDGTPLVATGSHNWSSSAENNNNENVVVVKDPLITNQYLQEFAARYHAAGGSYEFEDVSDTKTLPEVFSVSNNYPNPFNPVTSFNLDLQRDAFVSIEVFNILGEILPIHFDEALTAGSRHLQLNLAEYPSGVYIYRFVINQQHFVEGKMILLK